MGLLDRDKLKPSPVSIGEKKRKSGKRHKSSVGNVPTPKVSYGGGKLSSHAEPLSSYRPKK